MFGPGSAELFESLPAFDGLSPEVCKRMLSRCYVEIVSARSGFDAQRKSENSAMVSYLRTLVDTLEHHSVFEMSVDRRVRTGSAFVAAEAVALLLELWKEKDNLHQDLEFDIDADWRLLQLSKLQLEGGLLYLTAGFDANASAAVRGLKVPSTAPTHEDIAHRWALLELERLCKLGDTANNNPRPGWFEDIRFLSVLAEENPPSAIRTKLWISLGTSVSRLMEWLGGSIGTPQEAIEQLSREMILVRNYSGVAYADIFHIATIAQAALESITLRALRKTPAPTEESGREYAHYLSRRAQGHGMRPRPILWPAAEDYVRECLPGPHAHAVVTVPTGGGKSVLGELAVSHGIFSGWVAYLVPTNALANQVRTDLEDALDGLGSANIRSFLGADEYGDPEGEALSSVEPGTVAVMTPEKCALSLRLYPEVFRQLSVCVFDECHLLEDGSRGALAELVISHIISLAPNCKFLFMSAMIENPQALTDWLAETTTSPAVTISNPWRPTRRLRAIAGLSKSQASAAATTAIEKLNQLPMHRKRVRFMGKLRLLANLHGAWKDADPDNYELVDTKAEIELEVDRDMEFHSSWVNDVTSSLIEQFSSSGHQVLAFLSANKHYAFSVGRKLKPKPIKDSPRHRPKVEALLRLAEDELGQTSEVAQLLMNGVCVHTSVLLDAEKHASELAFSKGMCPVMIATGTLAQGLNLPASVAIVGGTVIGNYQDRNTPEAIARSRAQVLNALGRAARAGFHNHGLSILVPTKLIALGSENDAGIAIERESVLAKEDASTTISSRVLPVFLQAAQGAVSIDQASEEDLVVMSYLPPQTVSGVSGEDLLANSLASSLLGAAFDIAIPAQAAINLKASAEQFIRETGSPEWIQDVRYVTGLPFLLCLRVLQSLDLCIMNGLRWPAPTISGWFEFLFKVLEKLPPRRAIEIIDSNFFGIPLGIGDFERIDDSEWQPPRKWIQRWEHAMLGTLSYVTGETYSEIARNLGFPPISHRRWATDPLPKAIAFVLGPVANISRVAGALVAIVEQKIKHHDPSATPITQESLSALRLLPHAIRNGCHSRECLAWFRHGIRLRRAAHFLASNFELPNDASEQDLQRVITAMKRAIIADVSSLKNSDKGMIQDIQLVMKR